MSRNRILFFVFFTYVSLTLLLSFLAIKPAFYGLSTVLGTTVMLTSVLGTTILLGTTALGAIMLGTTTTTTTSLIEVYTDVLPMGQLALSLLAICMLLYLELSDPSYGKSHRVVAELRKSWLPLTTLLVLVFAVIVFFKVWNILA
jgi:hypothetical protein